MAEENTNATENTEQTNELETLRAELDRLKGENTKLRESVNSASADASDVVTDSTDTNASPETVAKEEDKPKPMPYGVLSKQYFDNPVENRLEKLGIPGRGVAMVLPNKLSQDEILAILRRPIQINEDDDEATVAAKERTAALKTEALKYIENGGTYDDFVREMVKVSNEEADMIRDARNEMMRLYKEEGAIAAIEYLKEANATLRENGLKEIPISTGLQKRAEEERAALEK